MNLSLVAGDKDTNYYNESKLRIKQQTSWQSLF